ncbi:MAG: HemK2/MTQ2 family protein methyltransferase [Candidatus Bathyarchaeia archaeon]
MNSQVRKVFFGKYVFDVCENVYAPAEDTFLLARNLSVKRNAKVLDVGTGCGILAVLAAEKASRVVAIDVNPYAVNCAKRNVELNRFGAETKIYMGDLFESVEAGEKFDLILFNSPYLPVEESEGGSWIEKAWAGGKTGRAVIDRFIDGVSEYLTQKGYIMLVQSSLSNVEETLEHFSQHKLQALIIDEEKSMFEKIVLIKARREPS